MKTKIFFITTAVILLLASCEKEVRDPGYFDGPTLSFNVAPLTAGLFGSNQDPITFEIIVNDGENVNQVTVRHLGGSNPIFPVPPVGATRTAIEAKFVNENVASITLPVSLNTATGKRRAVFSHARTNLGLLNRGTATVKLMAEITVGGNKVFRIIDVTIAGTAATPADRFRVTYDGNTSTGGFVPMDITHYASGGTVTVQANLLNLVKTGHKFVGWNTAADGTGTSFAPRRTFSMPTAHRTLFAHWVTDATPTFRVTYDRNGATNGSVPYDANIYIAGQTIHAFTNIYGLERTGKVFGGWNTQADGLGTDVAAGSHTYIMPAANVTLFAKWN